MPAHLLPPRDLGALLLAALTLAPAPGPRAQRNLNLDVERVKSAECEYRGIRASFEALTRAYAIEVYQDPRFLRWESRPGPGNPDSETLVMGVFAADGLRAETPDPLLRALREQGLPAFGVTWRLNKLWAERVEPYDAYARDALDTYQRTVDAFLARIVYVLAPSELRAGPGPEYPSVVLLEPGTGLLREEEQGSWSRVRVPATATIGWLPQDQLHLLSP